jgi:signal transduction histidine kinase
VRIFIATQIATLGITFNEVGVQSQLIDPAPAMLTLGLSGLVLGRRALWVTWAMLLGVFGIGFETSAQLAVQRGSPIGYALRDLPAVLITYSLVALILDRTVDSLRQSLRNSESSRRELQQEIRKREQIQLQLLHAHKLEATARLASGVAHDFNHLLAVMQGLAQRRDDWMDHCDPLQSCNEMHQGLADIESTADRGMALTQKLLEFHRDPTQHAEQIDLNLAIVDALPLLRTLLPTTITLHVQLSDRDLPVLVDRGELELMLLNLTANARDAMAGEGEIWLGTAFVDEVALIRIRDTGPGVPKQFVDQIFDPFFTTKPNRTGSGLGLSLVRDLLRSLGGDIQLAAPSSPGSEFVLSLPLSRKG